MSYDDWKCSDPRDLEEPEPQFEGEDEPEWTCDCGAPLDPSLDVSMCRACYDGCVPASAVFVRVDGDRCDHETAYETADTLPAPAGGEFALPSIPRTPFFTLEEN